eukprot:s1469_g6.t1
MITKLPVNLARFGARAFICFVSLGNGKGCWELSNFGPGVPNGSKTRQNHAVCTIAAVDFVSARQNRRRLTKFWDTVYHAFSSSPWQLRNLLTLLLPVAIAENIAWQQFQIS